MTRINALIAAGLAVAATTASPVVVLRDSSTDLVCGSIFQPVAGFFDFQAGNIGGNTENILAGVQDILSGSPKDIQTIVDSVTGGVTASLTNGVVNLLYGTATLFDNADPQCKGNAAYCMNEVRAASAACSSGQQAQAQDACLQAKYTCARNGNLNANQVNQMAPCCSQYTGSSASG